MPSCLWKEKKKKKGVRGTRWPITTEVAGASQASINRLLLRQPRQRWRLYLFIAVFMLSFIFPAHGPQMQVSYITNSSPAPMLYMTSVRETNKLNDINIVALVLLFQLTTCCACLPTCPDQRLHLMATDKSFRSGLLIYSKSQKSDFSWR